MADKIADKVYIELSEKVIVPIENDTPDVESLVKKIIELRDDLVVDEIKVRSDSNEFDCDGFAEVLREMVSDYLEAIRIDAEQYDAAISAINSRTNKSA